MKNLFKYSFYTISIILAITVAYPGSNCNAQNQLRIYEDIGGNGSTSDGSSQSDNTFIYVAGGLLIAGILAYAFLVKKDDKEETDTTSLSITKELINRDIPEKPLSGLAEAGEKFPVDIFFGIRNDEAVLREKTYLLGFSLKF